MFGDMAGSFTAIASVSPDVVRVEFYLDYRLVLNDAQPPFQWEFDTSSYGLGQHHFEVIAYDNARESASASRDANFVEEPFPLYFGVFLAIMLIFLPIVAVIASIRWPKLRKLEKLFF
jgi:hypothetical protein